MTSISSIVLAAGSSSRMGSDKALLKINGESVINIILSKISRLSDSIFIIRAPLHQIDIPAQTDCPVSLIYNPNPELGMFSSLKLGVAAVKSSYALIHLIDQPFIKPQTYKILAQAIDNDHQVFIPALENQNRSGHPIIVSRLIMQKINAAQPEDNLHNLLLSLPPDLVLRIPVSDHAILDNINTPAQLKTRLNS
jgi:molybdenum cofactor cytidylyltransferase